jgi:hypothetical protein
MSNVVTITSSINTVCVEIARRKRPQRADALMKIAQGVLSPSSPAYFELVGTLREFRFAATAIKVLAEYLQRNPGAILTGNR